MGAIRLRHEVPFNEADFELLCLKLLRADWDNPGLDLYAHRGDEQTGVDIIDLSGREPLSAAQCKLHEPSKTIPPSEIKGEVEKAERFSPKLGKYAILTTARASKKAHDIVLEINRKHSEQGLFRIELITWGKIENLLDRHTDIRDDFYATLSGHKVNEITSKLTEIHQAITTPSARSGRERDSPPGTLPQADSQRFAIAIAHLTHDRDHELERMIVESLRDLSGVQILQFDRMISAEGPIPEESEKNAHELAQELLRESSADVLIWGTVLSHSGRTAPRIYWTTSRHRSRSRQPYIPENFMLPEIFWEELAEVLRLLVMTRSDEIFAGRSKPNTTQLRQFVEKVRNALEAKTGARRWSPSSRTTVEFVLAMGLQQLGIQASSRDVLREAIGRYRGVLAFWTLAASPGEWATARNGLGIALGELGTIEPSSSGLAEALSIFQELLDESAHNHGLKIGNATIHNNLGNVLLLIGNRLGDLKHVSKAAEHYRSALLSWTRDRYPLDWAILQDRLGYALQLAGSHSTGTELLVRAVDAHHRALEELRRDQVPFHWAHAQNHLGNALKLLAERERGIELLEQAADAYRFALQERAFEQEPYEWAETQSNLGGVLTLIADRSGDMTGLEEAVNVLRDSLKVRTLREAPMAFASSSNNLGHALVRLGEFKAQKGYFEDALVALRAALSVWTRESSPARWSTAQQNLGDAYLSRARIENKPEYLDAAKDAYELALQERNRKQDPLLWASTQGALGQLFYLKAELGGGEDPLNVAASHYLLALGERPPEFSSSWAAAQYNLGNVQRLLGIRTSRLALISEALERHTAACRYTLPFSPYWAFRAAEAAQADIKILEGGSDIVLYHSAVAKHGWILNLLREHSGHQIILKPTFRAVVAGTSGTAKPDFSQAPRRGDRIKDGTVVWENAGKYSFCIDCNQFLNASMKK